MLPKMAICITTQLNFHKYLFEALATLDLFAQHHFVKTERISINGKFQLLYRDENF
jgi:hypothetical protein